MPYRPQYNIKYHSLSKCHLVYQVWEPLTCDFQCWPLQVQVQTAQKRSSPVADQLWLKAAIFSNSDYFFFPPHASSILLFSLVSLWLHYPQKGKSPWEKKMTVNGSPQCISSHFCSLYSILFPSARAIGVCIANLVYRTIMLKNQMCHKRPVIEMESDMSCILSERNRWRRMGHMRLKGIIVSIQIFSVIHTQTSRWCVLVRDWCTSGHNLSIYIHWLVSAERCHCWFKMLFVNKRNARVARSPASCSSTGHLIYYAPVGMHLQISASPHVRI